VTRGCAPVRLGKALVRLVKAQACLPGACTCGSWSAVDRSRCFRLATPRTRRSAPAHPYPAHRDSQHS
jgi:hypothetical protein